MDFNPLMLLAGNLTSIIQSSKEEGVRKMQKRAGSERAEEGRKGRKGEGKEKGPEAQMHLLSFPGATFASFSSLKPSLHL